MMGSTDFEFRAERAVSPVDGRDLWVVLDPRLLVHREASDFLRCLEGAGRSPRDEVHQSMTTTPAGQPGAPTSCLT